ncbi:hypothetical protein LJC10_01890 [Selenomonadales bacterium OttesenSCG-928-I06]|nr:hypothetical protein [Selenomonadales bacterium OttesenSCG-928-I06]
MADHVSKRFIVKKINNSFRKDILILILLTIVLGAIAASLISIVSNQYFSGAISSFVGDYGEHDVVIQVREELSGDIKPELEQVISSILPGAVLIEGSTITGKTSFFVALPENFKTKEIYENIGGIFGGVRGGVKAGIISEPRLVIRGVPEGAKGILVEELNKLEGAKFAFRDGGAVSIMVPSFNQTGELTAKTKAFLEEYQVIEITFPIGYEPTNPLKLGEDLAFDIQNSLRIPYAKSVLNTNQTDDMASMIVTMSELKKFLTAYMATVTVVSVEGREFKRGDKFVFKGRALEDIYVGTESITGNVVLEIYEDDENMSITGRVIQGDSSWLKNTDGTLQEGYKIVDNIITDETITVTYVNPRENLAVALNKSADLTRQIPGMIQDTREMSGIALDILSNYDDSVTTTKTILSNLRSAQGIINDATGNLRNLDTDTLQNQLDASTKTLAALINTLKLMTLVDGKVSETVDSLTVTYTNLENLNRGLDTLKNISAKSAEADRVLTNIIDSGEDSLNILESFDARATEATLMSINEQINEIEKINTPLIAEELDYLAAASPSLRDEDIVASINILDKVIDGQVIPGSRIQILTTNDVSIEAIKPSIANRVGHENFNVYSNALGIIEPNARAEVQQLLIEVKSVLAAIVAIVLVLFSLGLDHTTIMTVLKKRRTNNRIQFASRKEKIKQTIMSFFGIEKIYGIVVGAVLLTGMFLLSGAGLPYLPVIGVPIIGGFLGFIISFYTEKFNPIKQEEFMAGEALGLSEDDIMREIVIPNSRPGLLQKLNKRKMKFK